MGKVLSLREITEKDWKILLDWRNDPVTRQNFYTSDSVDVEGHKKYIKTTITDPTRSQFILEYNGDPVGTIREDQCGNEEFKLSYTVDPLCRGKKIGQIMMSIYLLDRWGSFLCEVKCENIPSIRMIKSMGFKFIANTGAVALYKLDKVL